MKLVEHIARWLAPERERVLDVWAFKLNARARDLDMEVNSRVASIVMKMDPWEPLLKRYNVVFSKEWQRPEDNLDAQSQLQLFMWAYGMKHDASFNHFIEFYMNTQGNNTVRRAKNSDEWFFGRASLATLLLLKEDIGRLSLHYEERLNKAKEFDPTLSVEE